MRIYDLMDDSTPNEYITLAYGNLDELQVLASKLFSRLNLAIFSMPSTNVYMLVLLYEIDFQVIK